MISITVIQKRVGGDLRALYEEEGLSLRHLARLACCSVWRIRKALTEELGVPIRPRRCVRAPDYSNR